MFWVVLLEKIYGHNEVEANTRKLIWGYYYLTDYVNNQFYLSWAFHHHDEEEFTWKEKFNLEPVSIQSKTNISVRFVLTRSKSAYILFVVKDNLSLYEED